MIDFIWFEDRYTNQAILSGHLPGTGVAHYGLQRLLPDLSATVEGPSAEASATLPAFALNRLFRLSAPSGGWDGRVRVALTLPSVYEYAFQGKPIEPAGAPTADAVSRPFFQRVEVDGEVSIRLYAFDADQRQLTVPGAMRAFSVRRVGARQGWWVPRRHHAQSQWQPTWDTEGSADLYTVSGQQRVTQAPDVVEMTWTLPLNHPDPIFGVEVAIRDLVLWVKQRDMTGSTRGRFCTDEAGFQARLSPILG